MFRHRRRRADLAVIMTIFEMKQAIRFYEANGFRHLSAPLGSSGHRHNDCWLILDLQEYSARPEFLRRPQPAE